MRRSTRGRLACALLFTNHSLASNYLPPLNDADFEKEEIRIILKEIGFNLADKPAGP